MHLLALNPPVVGLLSDRQVLGVRITHLLEPVRLRLLWETHTMAVRLEVVASEVDELLPLPVARSVVDAALDGVVVLGRETREELIAHLSRAILLLGLASGDLLSAFLLLGLASGDLLSDHRLNLSLLLGRSSAHLLSKGYLCGRHICVV
tara:strand:- start:729 stop:1178 length:450 start_codon:yes stop_codon:yes gene_type:complete